MSFLQVFDKIKEVKNAIGDGLFELANKIDSVSFETGHIVSRFLKMVHYCIGTPAWLMLCGMFGIALGLFMYRCLLIVLNVIKEIIPGIKGRIAIR